MREESSPRSSPQHVPGGRGSRQLKKACDLGAACFEKTALQWPIRRFSPNLLLLSRPNCKYEGSLSLCKRLIIKYFGKCGAPTSVESNLQSGSDVADLQFILENHLRARCACALEGCRAPRCKEDGYTALRFIPDIVGGWVVSDCNHRNQPRRSRPAGSIGMCGGSYCWRASSARGWTAADSKSAATPNTVSASRSWM